MLGIFSCSACLRQRQQELLCREPAGCFLSHGLYLLWAPSLLSYAAKSIPEILLNNLSDQAVLIDKPIRRSERNTERENSGETSLSNQCSRSSSHSGLCINRSRMNRNDDQYRVCSYHFVNLQHIMLFFLTSVLCFLARMELSLGACRQSPFDLNDGVARCCGQKSNF